MEPSNFSSFLKSLTDDFVVIGKQRVGHTHAWFSLIAAVFIFASIIISAQKSLDSEFAFAQVSSTSQAVLLGQTGEDIVGSTTFSPDGIKDVHILLLGVQGTITGAKVTGVADPGLIWQTPSNGSNWIVSIKPQTDSTKVDLYFDFWSQVDQYAVTLTFANGTTQTIQTTSTLIAPTSASAPAQTLVSGRTYYVSPTGSGTACAEVNPCSLSQGQNSMSIAGGDLLILTAGTYTGIPVQPVSGASNTNRNIVEVYPGATVVVRQVLANNNVTVRKGSGAAFIVDQNFESGWVVETAIITDGNNVTIDGLEARRANGQGVYGGGNNHVLRRLNIHDNGHNNGAIFCDVSPSGTIDPGLCHGIYWTVGSNSVIEDSEIHDNDGWGIHLCCSSVNSVTVRRNKVYNNGRGARGMGIGFANNDGFKIYNNLVYNNNGWGITAYSSGEIYNNSLYNNTEDEITVVGDPPNTIIKNNLAPGGRISGGLSSILSNNITSGLASSHFVNVLAGDFHLLSTSPAINAGLNLSSTFTTDFDGKVRDSQFDIGAYEFGGTAPAPTPTPAPITTATPPSTIASTLQASFLGATGEDKVGMTTAAPDGEADWHISLSGLRGNPIKTTVTAAQNSGHWETPFNGTNWVPLVEYSANNAAQVWIKPWFSAIQPLHIKVFYSDGTTDEKDAAAQTTTTTVSTKFIIGDRVRVTIDPATGIAMLLNVRQTPNGTVLGQQPTDSIGTILAGPTAAGGFDWYQIDYDTGIDGWSYEGYLEKTTVPVPTQISQSSIFVTPTVTAGGSVTIQVINGKNGNDWVGLYALGTLNLIDWRYLSGTQTNTGEILASFSFPIANPGTYEFKLHDAVEVNGSWPVLAVSNQITAISSAVTVSPVPTPTPAPVSGIVYHVRPTGSTSSTCDQILADAPAARQPQQAINCVISTGSGAGKTVLVHDGTYEHFGIGAGASGTAENYFTVKSENPLGAIVITKLQAENSVYISNADYVSLEGFYIDGQDVGPGIFADKTNGSKILNNSVTRIGHPLSAYNALTPIDTTNLLVQGNRFFNMIVEGLVAGGGIMHGHAVYLQGSYNNGFIFDKNIVEDVAGNAITRNFNSSEQFDNLVISNNIFRNVGHVLIGESIDAKIFNNIFINTLDGFYVIATPSGTTKIYNNTLYNSSGFIVWEWNSGNLEVENNIFYPGAVSVGPRDPSITNSGIVTISNNLCSSSSAGCSMVADPNFVNPAAGDFHLLSTSPAINAGLNLSSIFTTDFDGKLRDSLFDIGAYEFEGTIPTPVPISIPTPTPTITPTPTPLPGDLNNDKIVNSLDWSLMNSKWLTSDATADLNKDGIVNTLDYSLMNANWLKTI